MKRCPQCEFIYEDEQNTCDMDGTILAFESTSASSKVKQSPLRAFALPAIVGTMLAALLFVAFYASPLMLASPDARSRPPEAQTSPATDPSPEPAATQPALNEPFPLPPEVASDEPSSEPVTASAAHELEPATTSNTDSRSGDGRLTIRRGLPPLPRVRSLPRLPPARIGKPASSSPVDRNRNAQVAHGDSSRPSKVRSFLKKTGRIIKKPFRF